MLYSIKGVNIEQHKRSTLDKRLRKLLLPDHYNSGCVCLDPDSDEIMKALTPQLVIAAAEGCHVVDNTDGEPLADKLRRFEEDEASILVVDAADDEPYVTSSLVVLRRKQKAFLSAVECLKRAFGFERVFVATYNKGVYTGVRFPKESEVRIQKLRCRFPARMRFDEFYNTRAGKHAVVGAQAMLHLYRALFNAQVQNSTIVTVAGTAVGAPCNVEVSFGTPVSEVLALCGLTCEPAVVVRGGAMTGKAMLDLNVPVEATDYAFLAFEEPVRRRQYECVGCGRCARVCPRGLMPDYIYKNASTGVYSNCEYLMVEKCMECGCCSYICPSNIDLLGHIRKAKQSIADKAVDIAETQDTEPYAGKGLNGFDFTAVLHKTHIEPEPDSEDEPEAGERTDEKTGERTEGPSEQPSPSRKKKPRRQPVKPAAPPPVQVEAEPAAAESEPAAIEPKSSAIEPEPAAVETAEKEG